MEEVAVSGEQSRVYPLTPAWTTSNLHAGQFTAACGIEIYRGDALGDAYRGNAFVCEPTGNLVHREVLAAHGASFRSRPGEAGREFLASDDAWFRPVNLEVGPDGALYIVDMYRAVIEHPQFMPGELQHRADLRWGDDRGRIYRVVSAASRRPQAGPKLSAATTGQLVQLLRHQNAWWRETAARVLYERQDMAAVAALEEICDTATQPTARAQALWTLHGLNKLKTDHLLRAIEGVAAEPRQQAIRLAEPLIAHDAALAAAVCRAAEATDPSVQFRAVLCLGGLASPQAAEILCHIGLARANDPWMRRAVATAHSEQIASILSRVLQSPAIKNCDYDSAEVTFVRDLATIVGARRDPQEILEVLSLACNAAEPKFEPARRTAVLGIAAGLGQRGSSFREFVASQPDTAVLMAKLEASMARAAEEAKDVGLAENIRGPAIDVLRYDPRPVAAWILVPIATDDVSQALRVRAATALSTHSTTTVGPALLAAFAAQTPAVRRAFVEALAAQPAGAGLLLDAVDAHEIGPADIDRPQQIRLENQGDPALRARAGKLFSQPPAAERRAALEAYRPALALPGNPASGKPLFQKHCSACHKIGEVGVDLAPDISDSRVKTPEQLLTDILNPNQAIDNNYVSYTIVTHDGTVHAGIIASETSTSITLKAQAAKTLNLLRADIETIRSSGQSLMPEGLEKSLSLQELADLISFVKNWRYLAQPIPDAPSAPGSR
jgi:putative heme-binding domain-containing protein